MNSRHLALLALPVVTATLVGCPAPVAPPVAVVPATASAAAPSEQVQIKPLTADQLAQILGVQVWTARYSGGPIDCWLEIEEEGQSTLPKRIPDKGFLGDSVPNPPNEGTIDFWWTRREDRAGGQFHLAASNGSYGYGLSKDAFTFAWPSISAQYTTPGTGKPIEGNPGTGFVIVDYDAKEGGEIKPAATRRRVHLKLMGRFARPK